MPSPLSILFAGAGEFGLPTLKALLAHHRVLHIYTQPDRPAGRGKKLTPTPIGAFAEAQGLPLTKTPDLNAEPLPPAPPADVLVVIAFGQKIAPHVTDHPRLGALNLHASRLPKYRGAAPIHRAIMEGESVTGNSIIRLAPKMDAGAVLAMSELTIGDTETTGDLHDRLAADGAPLMLRVLEELAAGTATETEQDHLAATLARKISRETATLNFDLPAEVVSRHIRGLYPWPGCRGALLDAGGKLIVNLTLAHVRAHRGETGVPSTLLPNAHLACASGTLEVLDLQPEGKPLMSLAAFQNGRPWKPGMRIVPLV